MLVLWETALCQPGDLQSPLAMSDCLWAHPLVLPSQPESTQSGGLRRMYGAQELGAILFYVIAEGKWIWENLKGDRSGYR